MCKNPIVKVSVDAEVWRRDQTVTDHLHVVSPDNVESQHHLLHTLTGAEHPLVALVQDQVDGLIEALQRTLNEHTHALGQLVSCCQVTAGVHSRRCEEEDVSCSVEGWYSLRARDGTSYTVGQ